MKPPGPLVSAAAAPSWAVTGEKGAVCAAAWTRDPAGNPKDWRPPGMERSEDPSAGDGVGGHLTPGVGAGTRLEAPRDFAPL